MVPALIWTASSRPITGMLGEYWSIAVCPSPRLPRAAHPKQRTSPVESRAQVCT